MTDNVDKAQETQESVKKIKDSEAKAKVEKDKKQRSTVKRAYDDLVGKVRSFEAMTKTRGWKMLYREMLAMKAEARKGLEEEEKTRVLHRFQDNLKAVKRVVGIITNTLDELNAYGSQGPLFKDLSLLDAKFDEKTGTVSVSERKKKTQS